VHFLRKTDLGQDLLDSPKKPSGAQFRQSPSLYPKLFLLLRFLPLEHPTLITKNHWVFQQSARLKSYLRFAPSLGWRLQAKSKLQASLKCYGHQNSRLPAKFAALEMARSANPVIRPAKIADASDGNEPTKTKLNF
jgi:hypothetical protein